MSLIPKVGREHWRMRILLFGISFILWMGVIIHLYPVYWMFTTSIKHWSEVYKFPPTLYPHRPTFGAYKLIYRILGSGRGHGILWHPFYVYLKNSVIMVGAIMALQIPISFLVGYSLSKLHKPTWNRILFLFFIGTMVVPYQISLIPTYLILKHFPFASRHVPNIPFTNIPFPTHNFLDSYWAVVLPGLMSGFNILLFKGFFDTIPDEIINAARLDGSSELGILRRIILPLSKPVLAVVSYFTFSGAWNQFLWPLIVLTKREIWPLSLALYHMEQLLRYPTLGLDPSAIEELEYGYAWNGLMALAIVQSIPVFIMFIIFREQLMKGIKLRGFK